MTVRRIKNVLFASTRRGLTGRFKDWLDLTFIFQGKIDGIKPRWLPFGCLSNQDGDAFTMCVQGQSTSGEEGPLGCLKSGGVGFKTLGYLVLMRRQVQRKL